MQRSNMRIRPLAALSTLDLVISHNSPLWVWIVIFGFLEPPEGWVGDHSRDLPTCDVLRGIVAGLASACPFGAEEVAVFFYLKVFIVPKRSRRSLRIEAFCSKSKAFKSRLLSVLGFVT